MAGTPLIFHCVTAIGVTPIRCAKAFAEPTARIALSSGDVDINIPRREINVIQRYVYFWRNAS